MTEKEKEEKSTAADSNREQSTAGEKSTATDSNREQSTAAEKSTATDGNREQSKAAEKSTATDSNREQSTAAEKSTATDSNRERSKAVESKATGEASAKPAEPDWKTLYALTLADFDNFKKRAARDREDVYRYAESDILKDILPTVDNLALALANAKTDAASSPRQDKADGDSKQRGEGAVSTSGDAAPAAFVKGVQLVYDTLLKSLKDHGAEPFDSVGEVLDTERMEAIATLPHDVIEEGRVSVESKRGWMLKGKVLRAAQVVVSSGKPGGN